MYTQTGKQRRYLRALAHELKPIVQVGQKGLTESVLNELDGQLEHHELIKVRVSGEAPEDADTLVTALQAEGTDEAPGLRAEVVQRVGRVLTIYRPRRTKPTIKLPAASS